MINNLSEFKLLILNIIFIKKLNNKKINNKLKYILTIIK